MFSLECSTCASLPHVRKHDRGGRSRATRPIRNTTSALLLKNTVWIITTVVYDMKKIFPQMMTLAMLLCEGLLSGPLGPGRSPPSPSWHTPTPSVTRLDTETSTLSDWGMKWITRKALYLFDRTQNTTFPHMSILSDTVVTCDLRSLVLRLVVPIPKDEVVTSAAHFRSKGFHQHRAHSHACDVGNSHTLLSNTFTVSPHFRATAATATCSAVAAMLVGPVWWQSAPPEPARRNTAARGNRASSRSTTESGSKRRQG